MKAVSAYAVIVMVPVSPQRPSQHAWRTAANIRLDIMSILARDWKDVRADVVIEQVLSPVDEIPEEQMKSGAAT